MTQDETTLSQLTALIELFSPGPHTWTQGAFARLSPKFPATADPNSPTATCWCVLGGMLKLFHTSDDPKLLNAITEHINEPERNIVMWNDNTQTTYESFMAVLHKAHYTLSQRIATKTLCVGASMAHWKWVYMTLPSQEH